MKQSHSNAIQVNVGHVDKLNAAKLAQAVFASTDKRRQFRIGTTSFWATKIISVEVQVEDVLAHFGIFSNKVSVRVTYRDEQ